MKKNILLLLISSILAIAIAEAFCRYTGRYASYSERIGVSGYQSPYEYSLNSWYHVITPHSHMHMQEREFAISWVANNEGFKDTDFMIAKDKKRIMMIGDSYTEGIGADNDSSYPRQLGYILRDSLPTPTEVWNCGSAGSDLIFEYRVFHDKLLKYNPDMLIVVINGSDIHDVIIGGGFERFGADGSVRYKKAPWFIPLYAHSFLVRSIMHDVLRYNWQFVSRSQAPEVEREAVHTLTTAIDSFTRICAERHIKLLYTFHPTKGEFNNTMPYENIPMIAYCRDKQLPYIDMREELYRMGQGPDQVARLYWMNDGHCNNRGYYYFAKSVWRRVAEILPH